MRVPESVRSRPTLDNIMLAAVLGCLLIAAIRAAIVVAVVPYAYYVDAREDAKAEAAGRPEPEASVLDRIEHSPAGAWWARKAPYRAGGDYFGALARHSTIRSLGAVIGVVVEQERARGARVGQVLLPEDVEALYGSESGTLMVREDGTTFRSRWAPIGHTVSPFSDVEVDEADYDPQIDSTALAGIQSRTRLDERARNFLVGEPVAGGSGVWVLLALPGEDRQFIFVPIEATEVGDSL